MNTTLALVYTLLQQFKTIPCAIDIPFVQFFFPCTTIQKQFHAPSTSPSYNSFSPCTKRLEGAPAGIVQFFFTIPAGIVQFTYNTCGFFPSCTEAMCLFNFCFTTKLASQILHLKGFSPT